jgi:glycosyltransferase involved in cell wall biosynthesis
MLVAVVPAFEAERTLGEVVSGIRAAGVARVLVVDDGSRDATTGIAERAGAQVLRHPANRGKGAALWTGFRAAQRLGARAVVTLDADGQHDPADIPRLAAAHDAERHAVVIGVRALTAAAMPARSRLGNHVSTFFLRCLTGRELSDSQSGFRIYPIELISRMTPRARRFDAETELLLAAISWELPIVEVPVRTIYREGGATHFRNIRDTSRIVTLVLGWLVRQRLPVLRS